VEWETEAAAGGSRVPAVTRAVARNREELQSAVLRSLLLLATAITLVAWWQLAAQSEVDVLLLGDAVAMTLCAFVIWRLIASALLPAKLLFLLASISCITVAAGPGGVANAVYLYSLPVLASAVLFRRWAGIATAVIACGLAVYAVPHGALLPVVTVFSTGAWAWAIFGPIDDLMLWSWQRSLDATALAAQLQEQRGKLNRTIKDLDASYQLLRQTNRELAVARQEADVLRDMRSRFATNLSHELRTPLNIILGFAELIYLHPDLYGTANWTEALRRDLAQIQRNASYLSELVDDIVDLARIDAMAMPIRRQVTALRSVIDDAVSTVQGLAADKGLAIVVACDEALPSLLIDPVRVRQVLFNLVTNAIRYTQQGSVRVSARLQANEVMVAVSDTGCGIPEAELANIFNEFYQVARPKLSADLGKGLGLAIARRFVQLHGGRIWAESEVGVGSTFSFSLPLAAKSVSLLRSGSPTPLPKDLQRPSVLVLNDDGAAATYLKRRFPDYDFAWVETPDHLAASLAEGMPDAVIYNHPIDTASPGGWQDAMAALPETAPLIDCSLPSTGWLFGQDGFSAVLAKPVSPDRVEQALAKLLDGTARPSLLVVDDDRGFAQLMRRMLQSIEGREYRVATAYSGEEALRRLRRTKPDAVLVDLLMPGMTGFEMLQEMRRDTELAAIPVVAVTAATPGEDQVRVSGATFAVQRKGPFEPGELLRLLGSGLGLANPGALQLPDSAEA
jgi:signal transduction histidine kinase/CheY-like chemotaxis protein